MFFEISKYLWLLIDPLNLVLPVIVIGAVLLWSRWQRTARAIVTGLTVFLLLISVLPVGGWMIWTLKSRFPAVRKLLRDVNGIIVLSGSFDQAGTEQHGQFSVTGSAERLTEFARLARLYPGARLVFSGGSDIPGQRLLEADLAKRFFSDLDLDVGRIVFEKSSRNTFENATLTKALIPATDVSGKTWLLITSAFHMPRAVGSFRKAGWRVLPYPVDFRTGLKPAFTGGIDVTGAHGQLSLGIHEWGGLAAYRLMERTDAWLPARDDAVRIE